MSADRVEDELRAALAAAEDSAFSEVERSEMLVEIAMGLQQRPRGIASLQAAVQLYDRASALCPADQPLLQARIAARRATALQAVPGDDGAGLLEARDTYQRILPTLASLGLAEEVAEAEMNLGLVLQALAGAGRARITDAISAYQRALRTFDRQRFPKEFAILQNNLATAFLAIPFTDKRAHLREALAVQAFEEGLQVVTLVDHPLEYAMLQNNLGNALQYASSSHAVENNLRALEAYDEALRVRRSDTMPVEYANTVANKANCLWNLPDDPELPDAGNVGNLQRARSLYAEARAIFAENGEAERAQLLTEALSQLERELLSLSTAAGNETIHVRSAEAPVARQGEDL
jgi:tetratricopeptide (TPR) repeat protein